jgi:hypothetical protein
MVYVLLARVWVDDSGVTHQNGATVQVDRTRLPDLQKGGFVAQWWGPGGSEDRPAVSTDGGLK